MKIIKTYKLQAVENFVKIQINNKHTIGQTTETLMPKEHAI